jgi:hypothetical protein
MDTLAVADDLAIIYKKRYSCKSGTLIICLTGIRSSEWDAGATAPKGFECAVTHLLRSIRDRIDPGGRAVAGARRTEGGAALAGVATPDPPL